MRSLDLTVPFARDTAKLTEASRSSSTNLPPPFQEKNCKL